MSTASAEPRIAVEVVLDEAPHVVQRVALQLNEGATVAQALQAAGLAQRAAGARVGIWGRACALDQALRDRDRVEVYRPLQVDPKEARRQRYRRDGVKRAPRTAS